VTAAAKRWPFFRACRLALAGSGTVGLWTKAASVTSFDDFAYVAAGSR